LTRVSSIFSQILQFIPRLELNRPCASTKPSSVPSVSAVGASQIGTGKKGKFRFKSPLMSLDATVSYLNLLNSALSI
jgi:hypothetical protein